MLQSLFQNNNLNHRLGNILLTFVIGVIIFIISYGAVAYRNDKSPDIFTDEIIYTRLGVRIGGEGALVWDGGEPFIVHPPLYFIAEGLYFLLIGDPQIPIFGAGDIFATVYQARYLNAVFAGLTALVLFWFGKRLHSKKMGILLSLLFLIDPFGVRINRRAMLETLAALFALTGMAIYVGKWQYLENQGRGTFRKFINLMVSPRVILVGLFMGFAMLTKELAFTFLLVIVIHGAYESIRMILWGEDQQDRLDTWVSRTSGLRRALVITLVSLFTYSLYPIWIWISGEWSIFYVEKVLGLQRLLGVVQITGWNRSGYSIFDFIQQRLIDYGSSYLLITAGGLATIGILVWGQKSRSGRLLAIWGLVFYPFFVFLALVGSGNDQFFYFLLVTAIILTGYLFVALFDTLASLINVKYGQENSWLPALSYSLHIFIVVTLLVLVIPFNFFRWWMLYGVGVDNGYAQFASYVQDHIPGGVPINASGDPIKYRYFLPEYPIFALATKEEAITSDVEYFALTPKDVQFNYGVIKPDLAAWIQQTGTPLFAFDGDSYGDIFLYKVTNVSINASEGAITKDITQDRDHNGPSHWRTFEPAKGGYVGMFIVMFIIWIITWSVVAIVISHIQQKSAKVSTYDNSSSVPISRRNDPALEHRS